ncbi:recombinase family protein [Nonomuraea sp. NN258]|uniref:recombinase family protein n=1 Tax=Nonomuraea antri TaxID=2730852 RepID=UPI0015695966|nr:recombinase family protein [Nonomuraea antri]NRQ30616.1 recombinase family protein [Nonomuraea antri]
MLIEPRGGKIVEQHFDIDKSRFIPPQRRPEAGALLGELRNPRRAFDAVVVGEPQRAFYGNQFGNTFDIFNHFGVPLWVPEVGGPIDPTNEAHELIMMMFGGVSKGERNRIKVRVRTAMSALAEIEGRFLGGRPPYGYLLTDLGPHPNPAKAADGKRLHGLDLDPYAALVVQRIFAEFLEGSGLFAIAEGLTRDGIPCPSAHDPKRNRHRSGIAWSKGAVRTILTNPRYTGRQVWNRQRKDEVLLDVDDVTLGHTTKQRWNDSDKWIFSKKAVHPQLVDDDTFRNVQDILAARGRGPCEHKPHRTRHPYAFKGAIRCGLCLRKMQSQWINEAAYYRCAFAREYALGNKIEHPLNVYLREDAILPRVDRWLSKVFAPHRLTQTIDDMFADQPDRNHDAMTEATRKRIADVETKLARYRAAIEAGGDPAEIGRWVNEAKAERLKAEAELRQSRKGAPMSRTEIAELVTEIGDMARAVADAPVKRKHETYQWMGLRLTYHPGQAKVRAEIHLSPHVVKRYVSEDLAPPDAHGPEVSPSPNITFLSPDMRNPRPVERSAGAVPSVDRSRQANVYRGAAASPSHGRRLYISILQIAFRHQCLERPQDP